jgi:hypothetical protein
MGEPRARLTFANVVSVISLLFALGLGGAWAASELSKNEVKSKHIGKGQVRSPDLSKNSVTSPKVADASLLEQDFAPGQLPAGSPGEQGPQGERGPQGLQGTAGATNVTVRFAESSPGTTANSVESATVNCQAGERATGGGVESFNHNSYGDLRVAVSEPQPHSGTPTSWQVITWWTVSYAAAFIRAYVVCAAP